MGFFGLRGERSEKKVQAKPRDWERIGQAKSGLEWSLAEAAGGGALREAEPLGGVASGRPWLWEQ